MASRRQALSQRRKAVGFTQESLAERLGVERSTVIRWEAGDSEPLPSIRPNLARALHVSIDQLAELLTTSENAGMARGLPAHPEADPGATTPVLLTDQQPDAAELGVLIHPQVTETVEALRRALRSAGVSAEDLAAMLLIGGSSRVPLAAPGADVPEPPQTEPSQTEPPNLPAPGVLPLEVTPADVQRRPRGSQRFRRFAAVGLFVLALPAAWVSAPFSASLGATSSQLGTGTTAAVAASLAPNPGNSPVQAGTAGAGITAPAVIPADEPVPPGATVVQPAHTTSAPGHSRTVRRSAPPTTAHPPAPRIPAWVIPAANASNRWGGLSQIRQAGNFW